MKIEKIWVCQCKWQANPANEARVCFECSCPQVPFFNGPEILDLISKRQGFFHDAYKKIQQTILDSFKDKLTHKMDFSVEKEEILSKLNELEYLRGELK